MLADVLGHWLGKVVMLALAGGFIGWHGNHIESGAVAQAGDNQLWVRTNFTAHTERENVIAAREASDVSLLEFEVACLTKEVQQLKDRKK